MSHSFLARSGVLAKPLCAGASVLAFTLVSVPAQAQTTQLPTVEVTADSLLPVAAQPIAPGTTVAPFIERQQLPNTTASATADKLRDTVNLMDSEDAVKYMPSLMVRKRNQGDTQPVLATRTWGINSSARTLVYADDILLSALVANNNTIGAPRWGLIAPEEIERVDFLYGPFAAAYPGNSMGGVLQYTTKMPDKPFFDFKQTETLQTFSKYATHENLPTSQSSIATGSKLGAFRWFLSGNFQDSYSQPLTWITNGSKVGAAGQPLGGFVDFNKTGARADVVGAGGLLHTDMANLKLKTSVDITDWLTATYSIGFWGNDGNSRVQTYLRDAATGAATFGGVSGFASSYYSIQEQHVGNSFSLKTNTKGAFDWDISLSRYDILEDKQRNPFTVGAADSFSTFGKITRLDGTYWENADAKGIWRPTGVGGAHELSFGVHLDQVGLVNTIYRTTTWNSGSDSGTGEKYSDGRGTTRTEAFFLQDAWRFAPTWKLTLGGRAEKWEAFDGSVVNTTTNATTGAITKTVGGAQPALDATAFSPKATLAWDFDRSWTLSSSFGVAHRFPTVAELYQTASVGTDVKVANPFLKPEEVHSGELALTNRFQDGQARVSLFHEETYDALVSQTSFIPGGGTSTAVSNVDHIRNTGVEIYGEKNNVVFERLQVSASVTYVDSRIVANSSWAGTTVVVGKHAPYVPEWRATAAATYRPDDKWALTAALRYSGQMYSTLDNTDVVSNVYGAFDRYFVADFHANYKYSEQAQFQFGVDNVLNEKYTLFHSFPGRTFLASANLKF